MKVQIPTKRDPLGVAEGVTDQGGASVAQAIYCKGTLFDDIGVSASNSSGANSGDSTTGDFILSGAKNASAAAGGKNSGMVWVIVAVGVLALVLLWKKFR